MASLSPLPPSAATDATANNNAHGPALDMQAMGGHVKPGVERAQAGRPAGPRRDHADLSQLLCSFVHDVCSACVRPRRLDPAHMTRVILSLRTDATLTGSRLRCQ